MKISNRLKLVLFTAFFASSSVFAGWEKGETVPDLSEFGLVGELPQLEGKVTYIDFWASWCPPCKAAFPAIESIYQEKSAEGFQVVAVSVDSSEKAMQKFLSRVKPSFSVVWDEGQRLVEEAEIEVMPTSFLVDREGKIRAVHVGWRGDESANELAAEVDGLLAEGAE